MHSKFSQKLIKWTLQFVTIFLHVHMAGKLKPTSDFYDPTFVVPIKEGRSFRSKSLRYDEEFYQSTDKRVLKYTNYRELRASVQISSRRRESRQQSIIKHSPAPASSSPYKRLAIIYPIASLVHKYSLIFNAYLLIKYSILCTLDTRLFDEYRYLDCILLGRFLLDGRAVSLARHVVLFVAIINTFSRIQVYFFKDKYNFDAIEFMLTDLGEIKLKENNSANQVEDTFGWIESRRPIKSSDCWLFIAKKLFPHIIITLIGHFSLSALTMSFQYSMFITKLGFVLSQDHCVDWIVRSYEQQVLHSNSSFFKLNSMQQFAFDYIFIPNSINFTITNDMKTAWLKFENFSDFNVYHLIRIVISMLETWLFSFEVITIFFSGLIFMLVNIYQIRYYIQFIMLRLIKLKVLLEKINYHCLLSISTSESEIKDLIELDAKRLQLMMTDMFKTLGANNVFTRDFTTGCIYIWFAYSALAASWMFQPGPFLQTSKLECYLIHTFATIYLIILIASNSKLKHESNCLYKLSTSLMALTDSKLESKIRWANIMYYYHPITMNCFTAFENAQMSWLLGIKVVAWLFSALFVVSTFYNYYQ